jgi:glyoxylase-like metal-dependent hydrolase (beta-lactamase superfamily II)
MPAGGTACLSSREPGRLLPSRSIAGGGDCLQTPACMEGDHVESHTQSDPPKAIPARRRGTRCRRVAAGPAGRRIGSGESVDDRSCDGPKAPATIARRRGLSTVTRTVGNLEVVALLDAFGPFFVTREVAFPDATPRDWNRAERLDPGAFGPDGTWNLDFHCFAIRHPDGRIALVDTGIGPVGSPASSWAPVPGRLPDALAAAGVDPEDVDVVVLTHLHEDHYGWSVDLSGVPMFPNARYVVQQEEILTLTAGDPALSYVVEPLRRAGQLDEVDGRVRLLGRGTKVGGSASRCREAITAVPTPGHTPGHQSVLVESGRRQIIVTGDVLVHAVQLVDPDVSYIFESDQDVARDTRRALLRRAEDRRALLATAHLTRPFVPAG